MCHVRNCLNPKFRHCTSGYAAVPIGIFVQSDIKITIVMPLHQIATNASIKRNKYKFPL